MSEPVNEAVTERPTTVVQPVQPGERVQTLDVLRGFALFGILFVNVTALSQPAAWFDVAWNELGPVNYAVEVFNMFFTQGKFYTLFSLLFGLGFAVQLARAEQSGRGFALRFFWRVFILLLIGLAHVTLLWDGDILNTYAVAGMILLLFYGLKRGLDKLVRRFSKGRREKAPRWIALVVAGVLIFGPLVMFAGFVTYGQSVRAKVEAGVELNESEQNVWDQIQRNTDPKRQAEREERRATTIDTFTNGSYPDTVEYRIDNVASRTLSGPFWFMLAGIFTIGAYFGRHNFIGRAAELKSSFRKLLVWSLVIGTPLSALFVYVDVTAPAQPSFGWGNWLNFFTKTSSGLAYALAYIAAISLLMQTGARRWLEFFAPVGRTALSNYLLQSLIGTTVFYGYGFGLLGKLDAAELLVYIVLLFAFQVWLSRWWLARFRFGPAEWLWRSLTYFKAQPMRIRQDDGNTSAMSGTSPG